MMLLSEFVIFCDTNHQGVDRTVLRRKLGGDKRLSGVERCCTTKHLRLKWCPIDSTGEVIPIFKGILKYWYHFRREGDGREGDGREGDGREGDGREGDGSEGDGLEGDGIEGDRREGDG